MLYSKCMSRIFIALFVFVAAVFIFGAAITLDIFTRDSESSAGKHAIFFGNVEAFVDVARTPAERVKGLSGREAMQTNEGLLFVFEKNDTHAIWMKDMRFPIDIIWIDELFSVVDVAENVLPSSFPEIFKPKQSAKFVLEVNAGWVAHNNVRLGDKVSGLEFGE